MYVFHKCMGLTINTHFVYTMHEIIIVYEITFITLSVVRSFAHLALGAWEARRSTSFLTYILITIRIIINETKRHTRSLMYRYMPNWPICLAELRNHCIALVRVPYHAESLVHASKSNVYTTHLSFSYISVPVHINCILAQGSATVTVTHKRLSDPWATNGLSLARIILCGVHNKCAARKKVNKMEMAINSMLFLIEFRVVCVCCR